MLLFCLIPALTKAQNVSFDTRTYAGFAVDNQHADFNGDGREDFIYATSFGSFQVQNSNGDGTYGAPVSYPISDQNGFFVAIGDFNSDTKADLMFATGDNLYEYLNNGDGTFHLQFTAPQQANQIVTGDFNHDGKMDIAFEGPDPNSTSGGVKINVWFGNGDNGFTTGPSTSASEGGDLFMGDFDGDGKADLMIEGCDFGCRVYFFYGDNTGHFPFSENIASGNNTEHGAYLKPVDINGDGKTDLIGALDVYPINSPQYVNKIYYFYGNSARNWTENSITTGQCVVPQNVTAADVNGDGIRDLIVGEAPACNAYAPFNLTIMTGKGDGTYNPEQIVYTSNFYFRATVVRADRNTKPDIAIGQQASDQSVNSLVILVNQSNGAFPGCAAPNAFEGITVCSPGGSVTSPVHFSLGSSGQTPMRKMEVWVDGVKKLEQLNGFSKYAFLDKDLALADGSHTVKVFAAGWDNWLESKVFTVTVGNNACAPSSATTVVICSPTSGSSVSSPVPIFGQGGSSITSMEIWIDGAKAYSITGNRFESSRTMPAGQHTMSLYGKVNGTITDKKVSNFTVTSGNGCSMPASSGGVHICSPAANSSVNNPVQVSAKGGSAVTWMEGWIDGVKRAQNSGSNLNFSITLPAGSHTLTVYSRVNGTLSGKQLETFGVN